jgi:hypothetical protein
MRSFSLGVLRVSAVSSLPYHEALEVVRQTIL